MCFFFNDTATTEIYTIARRQRQMCIRDSVKTIMSMGGAALMAVGEGNGDERARDAATQALSLSLIHISEPTRPY